MKFWGIFFIGLLNGCGLLNAATPAQKKQYTMEGLVEHALKRRVILKALDQRIASNELSISRAYAEALPRLSISETMVGGLPVSGFPSLLSIQGGISLCSVNGARINYQMAQQDKEISKHEKELQKNLIRYNVEVNFINSWLLQEQMQLLLEQKEAAQCVYAQEMSKYEVSLNKKGEWLTAAAEYENKLGALKNYPELLHEGYASLEFLTNCPMRQEANGFPALQWTPSSAPQQKKLEEYYELAYKNRPELAQKKAEEQKVHYSKQRAQGGYIPDVSINAHYYLEKDVQGYGTDDFYLKPTVNVSWSINNSIQSYFDAEKADAAAVKVSLEHQELKLQIKKEVEVAYRQWHVALTNVEMRSSAKIKTKVLYDESVASVDLGLENQSKQRLKKSELAAEQFALLSYQAEAARKERALLYLCGYPS